MTINQLLLTLFKSLLILLSVFILGFFSPFLVSTIIVLVNKDVTYLDCMSTFPFWLFTIAGVIIAGVYINEEVTK